MGCDTIYHTPKGKEIDISPGLKSHMYFLLMNAGMFNRDLDSSDVDTLLHIASEQDGPKWDAETAYRVCDLVLAIEKHGTVYLRAEC